jgi:pimeloyl-ACP methyl ester carboxylesterase
MKRWLRGLLIGLPGLLVVLLVGPFLVPVPALESTVPVEELAEPHSRFVEVNGVKVHYEMAGRGEPVFFLLHGFGASTFSWREVMAPLAEMGTVVAFDRPAFGLTQRPMPGEWEGENPYSTEAQVALTVGLMDALEVESAILVGHSAGGTVSVLTALDHPERVSGLILVAPAVSTAENRGANRSSLLRPLLNTPQMRHLGPLLVRRIQEGGKDTLRAAWHDPSRITPQVWEGYLKPLQAENWDRALWEHNLARRPLGLVERLGEIEGPVLIVTGDHDRIVATERSVVLAQVLPGAELLVIPDCGHLPHEEYPEPFMEAVSTFLARVR